MTKFNEVKFCKDCEHLSFKFCYAPTGAVSLVTGKPILVDNRAELERLPMGRCGEQAYLFSPIKPDKRKRKSWLSRLFRTTSEQ